MSPGFTRTEGSCPLSYLMSHVPSSSLFVAFVSFCWNRLYRKLSVFRCSADNRQAAMTQRQRDLWDMGRPRPQPRLPLSMRGSHWVNRTMAYGRAPRKALPFRRVCRARARARAHARKGIGEKSAEKAAGDRG